MISDVIYTHNITLQIIRNMLHFNYSPEVGLSGHPIRVRDNLHHFSTTDGAKKVELGHAIC